MMKEGCTSATGPGTSIRSTRWPNACIFSQFSARAVRVLSVGYRLDEREADALLDQLDSEHTGTVQRSHLAASQMDWHALQERQVQTWLQAARHTFADLDRDGDGIWSTDDIISCLQSKLVPSEVCSFNLVRSTTLAGLTII